MMKRTLRKPICIILSVIMLLAALPFTVYATETVTKEVSTAEALAAACNEINTNGGEYTISLTADISGSIDISNGNAVVTVVGNGHTLTSAGTAVAVSNGATVNLGDGNSELTLKGSENNDEPGIVYVLENSVCNMYDKVTLKDHKGSNYFGGGVTVQGGTFHMYGGTIQNCGIDGGSVCYGGGVAVFDGGTFIMDNGIITECYVKVDFSITADFFPPWIDTDNVIVGAGGGVFVSSGSVFTMNGGMISKNRAYNSTSHTAYGGGIAMVPSDGNDGYTEIYSFGGAMHSIVTINGGMISENTADKGAGIYASEQHFAFASAFGAGNYKKLLKTNPGLFIYGGVISENNSTAEGGGVFLESIVDASENNGLHRAKVVFNNATITDNTSGARGAGVYYNEIVKLWLSGANTIKDNIYNDKLNNLNIYKTNGVVYPVYINGELTDSQIGLSDPTLWDDGLADADPTAVSANYLTSGYDNNNAGVNPGEYFTSDHETWYADYSNVNTSEVRLVRKSPVNYHINNSTIADAKYDGNDIFTSYVEKAAGKLITAGDTINAFYAIPEITPTAENSCPYIFKGWYYDQANEDDDDPVKFGTDVYTSGRDIYAHWIEVKNVEKDSADIYSLPENETAYGGFDLAGVQVREPVRDTNFDSVLKPGGMRFMTSLSMDVVNQINAIQTNNIEYGYVTATDEGWIGYHEHFNHKLQYVSATANGIDTSSDEALDENYFGFANNIVCTSKKINSSVELKEDHRNYSGYLLYTLVITYEDCDSSAYNKNVLARPYIKYTDANGLERVAYSEYRGTNKLGGCYTNYNAVAKQ